MTVLGERGKYTGKRAHLVQRVVTALGGTMIPGSELIPEDCGLFVRWGMRNTDDMYEALRRGTCIVCLDRGYFDATRLRRFSISVQGVHGLSQRLDSVLDLPPRPHPELQAWKPEGEGEFIQICAPGWSPGYWRSPSRQLPEHWVTTTAANAAHAFKLPAKIRYHPSALPPGERRSPRLSESLTETAVSVSYDSNCAVQTVIAGIPTILESPRAVAFPMAWNRMKRVTPDREAWIHDLSHREYDMEGEEELDAAVAYIWAQFKQSSKLNGAWSTYGIKEPK